MSPYFEDVFLKMWISGYFVEVAYYSYLEVHLLSTTGDYPPIGVNGAIIVKRGLE